MARLRVFSTKPYDRVGFDAANRQQVHEVVYLDARLDASTVELAVGADAVCVFVNDDLSAPVLEALAAAGVTCVALRCAGYNNVDLSDRRAPRTVGRPRPGVLAQCCR